MEDNAVIGAPGPYTWRGAIYVQEVSDDFLGRDKTMYYSPHIDDQSPVDKYSYLGMLGLAGFNLLGIKIKKGKKQFLSSLKLRSSVR